VDKVILIIAAFLLFGSASLKAQADSTRYINGMPVSQDDTATHVRQMDVEPYNRHVAVSPDDLPKKLRRVLDEEKYRGWQDTVIYYQKNTGIYIVPVKYSEGVKIFGLTERGEPVSFSEVDLPGDQ
jgi:hypothetical protein